MEKLTVGGVSSVLGTDGGSDAGDVVLQVLDVKPLGEGKKRARLSLSDGAQWTLAMAATQCFDKVTELVEAHALIRLTKYSVSENGSKKFVIVLGFDVVEAGAAVGARLGAPQEFGAGQRRATGVYFRAHLAGKREAIRPCHPR